MKKLLICIACLMAAAIIIPSVMFLFQEPSVPSGTGYVPCAIMVDGDLYYADLPVKWETGISVEAERLNGRITSSVHGSQWPTEDGQCNFMIGDDAAYAKVNRELLVRNYGKWTIFTPDTWDINE